MADRQMPHDAAAEAAVLVSCMVDPVALRKTAASIQPEDFYSSANMMIYAAMLSLVSSAKPVDVVTLFEQLRADSLIEKVGGASYVTALSDLNCSSANIEHYIRQMLDAASMRKLIRAGLDISERGLSGDAKLEEIKAILDGLQLPVDRASRTDSMVREFADNYLAEIKLRMARGLTFYRTGVQSLDHMLWMHDKELVFFMARPGDGKTSFMLQIALVNARADHPVLFASAEMGKDELVHRLLANMTRHDSTAIAHGKINQGEYDAVAVAAAQLAGMPLYLSETGSLDEHKLREMCDRRQPRVLVVDYLQRYRQGRDRNGRAGELSGFTQHLKDMAMEFGMLVVCGSQVDRRVDKDLIGSGLEKSRAKLNLASGQGTSGIEQDGDLLVAMNRPGKDSDAQCSHVTMTFGVVKHRNGPTGDVKVEWDKPTNTYTEATDEPA